MASKLPPKMARMITDAKAPLEMRKQLLLQLCQLEGPAARAQLEAVLDDSGESKYREKKKEYEELIQLMSAGPLRAGTFIRLGIQDRAEIALPDGTVAFCAVPDKALAQSLRRGDTVYVEAQGKAVLFKEPEPVALGEEATLERRVDDGMIEVSLREQGRYVFRAAADLAQRIDDGAVEPGATLIVCPNRLMAFRDLPPQDGLGHFRYLCREEIPDVVVERDIGSPPVFLDDLTEHVRMEMTAPELGRRYRLRRCRMVLLTGVPGSGKTLSILGFWNRLYEIMSEITGEPAGELPFRVLRFRASQVLSKWLGESDKHIDRFFNEVEELATVEHRDRELPVLVICEEIDGLARHRGEDAIHDRIQTTLLQRLDVTSQKLKDRLILFLFTTNRAGIVDPAFLRRAGGTTEHFGRLRRRDFLAVLDKHLDGRPFAEAREHVVADVAAWLFAPNGSDQGQVEITMVGEAAPRAFFRRDFLTGGLLDRAVQQASATACRLEREGAARPGLSRRLLMQAIDAQVRHIVDRLETYNANEYLDLPDGARLGTVRRVQGTSVLPIELERAS